MPRGQYKRTKRGGTLALQPTQGTAVIPADVFSGISGWEKLSEIEKETVTAEGQKLASEMLNLGRSRLAIGEHLSKMRDVLEPHNLFGKFLRPFHFSKRSAYRYIAGYQNAKARLPETIIKVAMARGFNIIGETEQKPLGIYTEAVAQLPPPKEPTTEQANVWLEQVDNVRKQARGQVDTGGVSFALPQVPQNPETLLKECYRFVNSRYKKLPSNHKVRQSWVHKLVGMVLADLGVGSAQTFTPVAVPEDYRAQRGRPRLAATA